MASFSDFLRSCEDYHRGNNARYTAQNYVNVVNDRKTWDNIPGLAVDIVEREMFGMYLFEWGKMHRCFPKKTRGACYELLLETITESADTLESLRGDSIAFVNLDSNRSLKGLQRNQAGCKTSVN